MQVYLGCRPQLLLSLIKLKLAPITNWMLLNFELLRCCRLLKFASNLQFLVRGKLWLGLCWLFKQFLFFFHKQGWWSLAFGLRYILFLNLSLSLLIKLNLQVDLLLDKLSFRLLSPRGQSLVRSSCLLQLPLMFILDNSILLFHFLQSLLVLHTYSLRLHI